MVVLSDVGQCACRTFAGSVRAILFIGCALIAVSEIASSIGKLNRSDAVKDIEVRSVYLTYGYSLILIGISSLGCYGAYKDHAPSIRVFLFAIALSILFSIGYLAVYYNTEALKQFNDKLIKPLVSEMGDYDWSHKDTSEKRVQATSKWDDLQKSAMCCGNKGPQDWDMFRPQDLGSSFFPGSCCAVSSENPQHFCTRVDTFMVGCHARIEQLEATLLVGSVLYALFQSLLLIIGLFALCRCCFPQDADLPGPRSTGFRLQMST